MARSIQSGNDESLHKAELAEYEANSSNTNLQSYMQVQADIVSLEDKFEQIRKLTNCETLDEVVMNNYDLYTVVVSFFPYFFNYR